LILTLNCLLCSPTLIPFKANASNPHLRHTQNRNQRRNWNLEQDIGFGSGSDRGKMIRFRRFRFRPGSATLFISMEKKYYVNTIYWFSIQKYVQTKVEHICRYRYILFSRIQSQIRIQSRPSKTVGSGPGPTWTALNTGIVMTCLLSIK
jgi:hypothetical protein